jgi:hypothetical protein
MPGDRTAQGLAKSVRLQKVMNVSNFRKCFVVGLIANNLPMLDRPIHKRFLEHIGVDISGSPMIPVVKKCRIAAGVHS